MTATEPQTVDARAPRTLLFIVGPPAVGKMTVGAEIARRTGLRLLHNHHTIDLVLRFFPFGSPPFGRLVSEFRRRIVEEVAASDLPGLIFTYVWAFDHPSDEQTIDRMSAVFQQHGGRAVILELETTLDERLRRNETEPRLTEKPSKRDIAQSRAQLLADSAKYQLNSGGRYDHRADYFRLDNTEKSPGEVAEMTIARFGLPESR
jgi:shikimate kinase